MAQYVNQGGPALSDPANHELAAISQNLDILRHVYGREGEADMHNILNLMLLDIFQFMADDQAILDCVPNFDGSNIESYTFQQVWKWFRSWLSILHYRSLLPDPGRRPDLRDNLHAIAFQAVFLEKLEKDYYTSEKVSEMSKDSADMQPFRRLYEQAADQLAASAYEQRRIVPDLESQMLMNLILAEHRFEQALRETHVEDVRLEKRFDRDELDDANVQGLQQWHRDIITINTVERTSFLIRQLRQHGYKRPWKQVYLVLNDSYSQEFAQAIRAFTDFLANLRPGRALDVKPLALSTLKDESCAILCATHDDQDFGPGDLVIQQQCNHYIHQTCFFQTFDTFGYGNFSFPCPLCRNDPGRLNDKLAIDVPEEDYNPGFDPDAADRDAFQICQHYFHQDYTLLERQHELPANTRHKALREQRRVLDHADAEDQYYNTTIANWNQNPQNADRPPPRPPNLREGHEQTHFYMYEPEQDDSPPDYPETHYIDHARQLLALNIVRAPELLEEHLYHAWKQWVENYGSQEDVAAMVAAQARVEMDDAQVRVQMDEAMRWWQEMQVDDEDEGVDVPGVVPVGQVGGDDGGDGGNGGGNGVDGGNDGNGWNGGDGDGHQNAFARWKIEGKKAVGTTKGKGGAGKERVGRRSQRVKNRTVASF